MPILIAHRGLLEGPSKDLENHPETLERARSRGYDIEIDLWFDQGRWYLGHDAPTHECTIDWLSSINRTHYLDDHHAWIHAKNIDALYELRRIRWEGHVFWHQNDDVTLTSTGYLWTYPGKTLTPLSICVMPEWVDMIDRAKELDVHGFCTDHVLLIEQKLFR